MGYLQLLPHSPFAIFFFYQERTVVGQVILVRGPVAQCWLYQPLVLLSGWEHISLKFHHGNDNGGI